MADVIELRDVVTLRAGAVGRPGDRTFVIEARTHETRLRVLVEKEQVALLATEAVQFLDKIAEDYPEPHALLDAADVTVSGEEEPLFRARLIGLGFEPESHLVLVELREEAPDDDGDDVVGTTEGEGYVARVFATRAQVRAMATGGAEAVQSGRARWN